jgi:hypothetical protein
LQLAREIPRKIAAKTAQVNAAGDAA